MTDSLDLVEHLSGAGFHLMDDKEKADFLASLETPDANPPKGIVQGEESTQ